MNHSRLIKKREKYLHTLEKDKKFIKREIILLLTCFVNTGSYYRDLKSFFFNLYFFKHTFNKGLTWIFGFLVSIPESTDAWMYVRFVYALVFCLLNSTQGVHVFIVYLLVSRRRHQILKGKVVEQVRRVKRKFHNSKERNSQVSDRRRRVMDLFKI